MLRKTLLLSDAAIKLDGDTGRFAGYASVFGGVDSYGDTVVRGAYDSTLRNNGKPKMFFNHDSYALPIGKWLAAKEDDHGLFVEGELTAGNPQSDAVRAALKHGTVDGLSIGYYLKKGDFDETEEGRVIRKVSRLVEVSVVTFPADEAARVDLASVKSEDIDGIETVRDFERFLRDAGGLSKGLATALVSRAKLIFAPGEPDAEDAEAKAYADLLDRIRAVRIPQ
ncbi:MAG: HK97 family phage prohead protease [Alphaproteobacteria bacterium]|nr:HK97 family phage prohead protease [Alphaproteobacteria bacterium]